MHIGPHKKWRGLLKRVCAEVLTSEAICHDREPGFMLIYFVRLIGSWDRTNELLWFIDHKQQYSGTHGTDVNKGDQDVCVGRELDRLG